ncbi:MAG: hypothetical protein ACXWN0_00150 [Isosphaeraceae bacterium]
MSDSVDERIRTVLDLGDSSAAVKGLDAEVEKLLAAFQKQTELFEQKKLTPQQYADALHKVKSEVSGLSSAMKELGGGGGGGVDFEAMNRKLFALERGMTSMVSGTGLGRAGGMLESGLSLLGGPAGLGVMAALIANTIDQIAPKIKLAWDNLFHQFSQEDVTAKIAELKTYQTQLQSQVKALLERPVPGTEDLEATRQKYLGRLFNVGTLTGPQGMSHGLVKALRNAPGATSSELTAEEKQELELYWGKLHPKEQAKKMWEQGGGLAVASQVWDELSNIMAIDKSGQAIFDQKAKEGMNKILYAAVQRTVGKLMVDAQKPGKEGRDALTLLKDLATRFPDAFKGGLAAEIDKVLHLAHQIQDLSEQSHTAAAVVHHPGATDIQREQEIEAMEQGRTGSRSQLEGRQRQMFERQVMQRMMEQQGLKMSDPNQRAMMEHQAADEWAMAMGGPHTRSGQERMERDMVRRQRTIELIGEHPEMTFEEAEAQARKETTRRERAAYPERFRGERHNTPEAIRHHEALVKNQMRRGIHQPDRITTQAGLDASIRGTETDRGQRGLEPQRESFQHVRKLMDRAVAAQHAGLISQEKMTQIVRQLQGTIDNNIMPRIRRLNKEADDLARKQAKSAQNTTGNP